MTIGEYIEAVATKSLFPPKTIQSYAQALRKIAGEIAGEPSANSVMPSNCAPSPQRRSKPGGLSPSAGRRPIP